MITISVTPIQAIISFVIQAWIIIFPIIVLKKINHLTALINGLYEDSDEEAAGK